MANNNLMVKVVGAFFLIVVSIAPAYATLLNFSYETIDGGGNRGNGSFLLDTAVNNSWVIFVPMTIPDFIIHKRFY